MQQPVKEVLAALFPELKESGDERIRKRLIQLVNDVWDDSNFGYLSKREDYNGIVAWLEKHKPAEWDREDEININAVFEALNQVYGISENEKLREWLNNRCNRPERQ